MEDDGPPGVPEWVVTYGDMMSLLLTFFIMLVSLSEVVADQKYRAILDALQQYSGYRTAPEAPAGQNFPLNSTLETLTTLGAKSKEKHHGGGRVEAIKGEQTRVFRKRDGKSIPVGKPVPFLFNESLLDKATHANIRSIAEQLAGKPNKIEIKGHADIAPLPEDSPWADKTELTYHRARLVYEALASLGVEVDHMRISAAGDRDNLLNATDEKLRQHDRVDILILNAFANDFVNTREK